MSQFISVSELKTHRNEYIVLDVRGDVLYGQGHIPGAFCVDLERDLTGPVVEHGGRHPLPNMDDFAKKMERMGITTDSKIVICDEWIFLAGRLWWMLRYIGLDRVYVLDGGIQRWVAEGGQLSQERTTYPATVPGLAYGIQEGMTTTRDEVLASSVSKDRILIDARSPERYDGSVDDVMDGMTGHVPSAINCFFGQYFTDDGVLSRDELEAKLGFLRKQDRPIVAYCGSGITACLTLLAMKEIGIDGILYVGSSSDWMTYDNPPLQRGVETL